MRARQIYCARHLSLLPLSRHCSPSSPIKATSACEYVVKILMLVCLLMDEDEGNERCDTMRKEQMRLKRSPVSDASAGGTGGFSGTGDSGCSGL